MEQEEELAKSIYQSLVQENYSCELAYNIVDGKRMIENHHFDCILLDISISEDSGLTFLKDLRKEKKMMGVIILSVEKSIEHTITSLKFGADDYLVKPIHLAELSARIEAIIRRKYLNNNEEIRFQNLKMNTLSRIVTIDEKEIILTRTEYQLLLILLINKGRVVSKEEIAERLSGQSAIYLYNFDILYTHIKNLKKKLLSVGKCIRTVYGAGYMLSE